MRNLQTTDNFSTRDFLARADMLGACGMTVLISDYFEYYRLAAYLNNMNKGKRIGLVMGVPSLLDLLTRSITKRWRVEFWNRLVGFSKTSSSYWFIRTNLRVWTKFKRHRTSHSHPICKSCSGTLWTINVFLTWKITILPVCRFFSRCDQANQGGDPSWEKMVPLPVAKIIRERNLLGYQCPNSTH